jgi:hypothetical protein
MADDEPWLNRPIVRPLVPANLPRHEPDEPETAGVDPAALAAPIPVVGGNAPGYRQSDILPLARREDVINNPNSHWYEGWALAPGPLRALGQTPAENTTINPNTGTMNIAPEALAAATALGGVKMGRPLEIQPTTPTSVPPGLAAREAPLSADFRQAPIAPPAAAKIAATPPGDLAPGVPANQMMPRAAPSEPTAPSTTTAAPEAERILASAKSVANQHYDIAKANGQDSSYTPQSVGRMVDAVDSAAPQGPGERAVGGENAVTRLQRDMQPLRDQPLTLADVQRMDERMSDHITEELRAGRNKVAGQLEDIQQKWREQADGVTADDVTGGQAGFQALDPARKAWSQYRKMSDVMLMKERADMTQNPTTSYQTAVRNFVTGKGSRGWTAEEKAALQASADRGAIGGTLHLLGSRLLPHVGGAVGASVGGIPGFIAGEVVTHGLGASARNVANTMQTGRVNRAMGVLGSSVPDPPINQMLRY